MREICELRLLEKHAHLLFGPLEGQRLGTSIRKIKIATNDPRYKMIGSIQSELIRHGNTSFFRGWRFYRYYTKRELESAELFLLKHKSIFEPAGEEYGTKYDEATACPRCGSGALQVSDLILDENSLPKGKDISKTIAGEIVVSKRLVSVFSDNSIQGVNFRPIHFRAIHKSESKEWFQMLCDTAFLDLTRATKIGIEPFDEDISGKYRCSCGDLAGLALLSEVSVNRPEKLNSDVWATKQYVGVRRGLLRPQRQILISQKVNNLMRQAGLRGYEVEIAHFIR